MGNKIRNKNMQQFRNGNMLACNRMMSVKTKKSGKPLKSSLEVELIKITDYLYIR